jgi:predicted transport protein
LDGKSPHTVGLFNHLASAYQQIGNVSIRPLKSMIAFSADKNFAYVIQLGKNFIDVVFPFNESYSDNLCFNKIKQVPGTTDYNHHLRIFFPEDINDEVRSYMRMAYQHGCA